MEFSYVPVQLVICALIVAAVVIILVSRLSRFAIRRVFMLILSVFLVTVAYFLQFGPLYRIPIDVIIAVLLIELGILAYVYDYHRGYRSISGNLRNMGGLYIFIGVVCLLSRLAGFPVWLWVIPIILLALGYFFLRRRKGLANLCKGAGVIVSVAFIASMIYDVREGAIPTRKAVSLRDRLLPEIVKPSIIEDLNTLNEKLGKVEEEKKRLSEQLLVKQAKNKELKIELDVAMAGRREAEEKLKEIEKEKAASEKQIAEFEKAKSAAKESFSNIEGKLNKAAENLKKTISERDDLKAEVERLKAATTPQPSATSPVALDREVVTLKEKLKQSEEERQRLMVELQKVSGVLEKIKEALVTE
jgi:hypothetical protein